MTSEAVAPVSDFLRVLYVEDDARHRELTKESLEQRGPFLVDFASDLTEADQHVGKNRYDVVLIDVDLTTTDTSGRQGDDWLRARFADLHRSFVAIVTAQKPKLRHGEWLRDQKIPIVEKGHDEVALYNKLAERIRPSPAPTRDATQAQEALMGPGAGLTAQTLSLFYDWVDSLPDGEVKDIWFGGRMLSPQDLKQEMMRDTPIGKSIAALFLDHARAALGLGGEVNH